MAELRGHVGGAWEADPLRAPVLSRTTLLPDTPHRFLVWPSSAYDLVRLDVFTAAWPGCGCTGHSRRKDWCRYAAAWPETAP